jgi:hypothetical protein
VEQGGVVRQAPRRAAYMFLNVVAGGLLFSIVLLALWLHSAVESIARGREQELATRVVLKPIVGESQAQAFAERLESQHPGLDVAVIGPPEARALLALQEPWMKNLPEVEVASLPTTLEIRDPEAFSNPQRLMKLHEELRAAPETDFIVFNDFLFDRFATFVRSARGYAGGVLLVLAALSALVFVLFNFGISGVKGGSHGLGAAIVFIAVNATGAAVVGAAVWMTVRRSIEAAHGKAADPEFFPVALAALGLLILVVLLELKNVRIRRRRRMRIVRK